METSLLKLVIELSESETGAPEVTVQRCDRPVSYGPVRLEDLPYLIEALLPPDAAEVIAATRR